MSVVMHVAPKDLSDVRGRDRAMQRLGNRGECVINRVTAEVRVVPTLRLGVVRSRHGWCRDRVVAISLHELSREVTGAVVNQEGNGSAPSVGSTCRSPVLV